MSAAADRDPERSRNNYDQHDDPKCGYVFAPAPRPRVPVVMAAADDDDVSNRQKLHHYYPVHRIYCVARNYADHAREMGHIPPTTTTGDGEKAAPFFFAKPADAVVAADAKTPQKQQQKNPPAVTTIPFPLATDNLHHEVELVVAMGEHRQIFGYAVGVDLTRRDLQAEAKRKGRPWCTAKGFDNSAPIGCIYPVSSSEQHPLEISAAATLWLDVNGERRQTGTLDQMLYGVEEIIDHLSRFFELKAGDLIFTGTPAGVGPIKAGDTVTAGINGLGELAFTMGPTTTK